MPRFNVARRFYEGAGRLIPASFFGIHSHRWPVGNSFTFTADASTNRIQVSHNSRGNYDWMHCYVTTDGVLPAPLGAGQYWCLPVDSSNVKLALTQGGSEIDITSAGSGTHSIEFRAPGPTYSYGHFRSWDAVRWGQIHTADDTYDSAALDAILVPHINAGAKIMWCAAGTPTWASSNSGAAGVYANGDTYPPINISSATGPLKEFITWLVTRYNKASGGVFGTDSTRIQWVEVWNEPSFPGAFYAGTASELAQIAKAIKEAAQAVDPAVQILAPGWGAGTTLSNVTSATSAINAFMTASDGAAGVGADHVTGFAWHPYGRGAGGSDNEMIAQDAWARSIAARYGLDTLHATEWGDLPSSNPSFTDGNMAIVLRTIAMQAGLGWETSTIYGHDNVVSFLGPVASAKMSALLDAFKKQACGKLMTRGEVLIDGEVMLSFNDGSTYVTP